MPRASCSVVFVDELAQFFIGSMAFATYAVHIQKPENRLDLAFILLLTTVAFKFTVNSSLPRISYLTTMASETDIRGF